MINSLCSTPLHLAALTMLTLAGSLAPTQSQSIPGLPEPGILMYGRILDKQTQLPIPARTLQFTAQGNNETVQLDAKLININGQLFYTLHLPFETRFVSGQTFAKTPIHSR